jgi:hypothetical protein
MRASRLFLAWFVVMMSIGVAAQQPATAPVATAPGPDEVAISFEYTGPGQVSEKNRIWVWLFDTPEISARSNPIDSGSISKNGDTVKFKVASSLTEVYVAAAYDNVGGFMGDQAPPPGTPIVIYGRDDKAPAAPIEKGASVKVKFDDTVKMQ